MKKLSLAWKGGFLCLGALLASLFGPVVKKNESPDIVHARIEKNLGVIERYMDAKYGEGFFREQISQHASRTEIANMLKEKEVTNTYEDYVRTL